MNDIINKIKMALGSVLSDADKATIKEYQTKLADAVVPQETPAPEAPKTMKTKEGAEIMVEGELTNGSKVFVVKSETEKEPAQDGAYTLEDNTVLVVTGGLITEVKKAEEAPANPPMDAEMKALKAELDANKNEVVELKKMLGFTLSKLDDFLKVPVETEVVENGKTYEELSPLERYNLENPIENLK